MGPVCRVLINMNINNFLSMLFPLLIFKFKYYLLPYDLIFHKEIIL